MNNETDLQIGGYDDPQRTPPQPMQGISAAPVSGEGLYRWVKASEMFPIRKDYEETGDRVFIRNVQTKCGGMVLIDEFYKMEDKHNIEWLAPASEGKMFSMEDMEGIVRFTISQWASIGEQKEDDHQELITGFLNNDLTLFISSLNKK